MGFVDGLQTCVGGSFIFPSITAPGFGSYAFGSSLAPLAGFNYVLNLLPPQPPFPPSIPDISLFTNAFLGGIVMPANHPAFNFSLAGVTISIPSSGTGIAPFPMFGPFDPAFGFSVGGMFNFLIAPILAPFLAVKQILTGFPDVTLPTLDAIKVIVQGILISMGFGSALIPPSVALAMLAFGSCLATAIFTLMGTIL